MQSVDRGDKVGRRLGQAHLGLFAVGFVIWIVDKHCCTQIEQFRMKYGIDPQLHALWHVLTVSSNGNAIQFREL